MSLNPIIQGSSGSPEYFSALSEGSDNSALSEFTLDSSPGKYSTTVSNILSKHCTEIKQSSEEITQTIVATSKKKLKELITKHNNELFSFMSRPDKTPNMVGLAEGIFRKYGQDIPTIKGVNTNTVLKDLNLDASVSTVVAEFDDELKKLRGVTSSLGGLDDFLKQSRWIFNQYKIIGEEVLRLETNLYQKIEILDKINNRIQLITNLTANDALPELIDSFKKYVGTMYASTQIETTYKELIECYKKWNICRQIISQYSNFKSDTCEPQCSICLNEVVSYTIVPCGHTFCNSCIKKQNTTCYMCRGTIRERVKLFFT
jgi:hypothetical protein